jgi:hypothetical protein
LKIKNGVNKQILRKAMTELPSEIKYRNDKKGFTIDENLHQNTYFFELIKKSFKESALGDLGYINVDLLKKEIQNIESAKSKIWVRDLNRILFAEIWAKKFL